MRIGRNIDSFAPQARAIWTAPLSSRAPLMLTNEASRASRFSAAAK
jgi:hypothetical protein